MAVPDTEYFDAGLKNGVTYRYTVRAARTAGAVMVEGPASGAVEAVPADRMAPSVPLGAGAFVTPEGVKVIWWPNQEEDLAGYHVYRRRGRDIIRLTDSPIKASEFMDTGTKRRRYYRYTVTALDKAGNESPHSEPARVYIK